MREPTVCAVMLTADRPELARCAVECFRRQTYPEKRLLIYDTGTDDAEDCPGDYPLVIWIPEEWRMLARIHGSNTSKRGRTIGELRNAANSQVEGVEVDLSAGTSKDCGADILIHWDDDDWSHPNRIAEQVALLQSSGADVVGYNEMLFWRETPPYFPGSPPENNVGEAWLYTGSILGTSLCYWRKTWERVPFRSQRANPTHDKGVGEDHDFLLDLHAAGMKSVGVSSLVPNPMDPLMIARIHGSNTSNAYNPADMARETQHWKRVPEWDQFCRRTME